MTLYHLARTSRSTVSPREPRSKHPLVILTYRHNRFEALYTSTPAIQFVRLDLPAETAFGSDELDAPRPVTARPVTVSHLAELPVELRIAVQRAFRLF